MPDLTPLIPDHVHLAGFLLAMALAVVITGIAKAGFGGGIGILAVPLTIAVLPARQGLGVMLPLLIVGDLFAWRHHRGNHSQPHLRWLLAGAAGGIALATALLFAVQFFTALKHLPVDRYLNLVVGAACLIMVAAQVYRLLGGHVPHLPPTALAGRSVGGIAGFVSMMAHSAGPVVNVYLLEQRLDKTRQTGTAVLFFLLVNACKLPFYLYPLAWIDPRTLATSALFIPLIPIGTWLGYHMHRRVPEKPFAAVMYLGAAAGAAWMIYKSMT